jgi:sigma-E factor negative regulatory protein RseC
MMQGGNAMIVETGRVMKAERGKAVIELLRKAACDNCTAGCHAMADGAAAMVVEVSDPIGVRVGQSVQISLEESSALKASTVAYGIPLVAVIVGGVAGDWLGRTSGNRDLWAMIGGFGCLGLSLLLVRFFSQRFNRDSRNQPVITEILG